MRGELGYYFKIGPFSDYRDSTWQAFSFHRIPLRYSTDTVHTNNGINKDPHQMTITLPRIRRKARERDGAPPSSPRLWVVCPPRRQDVAIQPGKERTARGWSWGKFKHVTRKRLLLLQRLALPHCHLCTVALLSRERRSAGLS